MLSRDEALRELYVALLDRLERGIREAKATLCDVRGADVPGELGRFRIALEIMSSVITRALLSQSLNDIEASARLLRGDGTS